MKKTYIRKDISTNYYLYITSYIIGVLHIEIVYDDYIVYDLSMLLCTVISLHILNLQYKPYHQKESQSSVQRKKRKNSQPSAESRVQAGNWKPFYLVVFSPVNWESFPQGLG